MAIRKFEGDNAFLSNMYYFDAPIVTPDGIEVHTSEQLYLPSRFVERPDREVVEKANSGINAKRLAKQLQRSGMEVRQDWEQVRIQKMRDSVTIKFFSNPELMEKLIATGEQELIEGNNHRDDFWGVYPPPPKGTGENWLGRILMETRTNAQDPNYSVDIDKLIKNIFS